MSESQTIKYTYLYIPPTLSLVLITALYQGWQEPVWALIHHAWIISNHLLMSCFLGCIVEIIREVGRIERPWSWVEPLGSTFSQLWRYPPAMPLPHSVLSSRSLPSSSHDVLPASVFVSLSFSFLWGWQWYWIRAYSNDLNLTSSVKPYLQIRVRNSLTLRVRNSVYRFLLGTQFNP